MSVRVYVFIECVFDESVCVCECVDVSQLFYGSHKHFLKKKFNVFENNVAMRKYEGRWICFICICSRWLLLLYEKAYGKLRIELKRSIFLECVDSK